MSEALLRVNPIETFYGPIQAIRGVSLDVDQGQIVTVWVPTVPARPVYCGRFPACWTQNGAR